MDMEVDQDTSDVPVHVANKIRFKEDVIVTSNNLSCEFIDTSRCVLDLGLLSEGHSYEVRFFMAHFLGHTVEIPQLQTPAISVTDLKKFEGKRGHRVTLEVKCGVDGYMEEEVLFENEKNDKAVLKVCAKVMASHSGTPALKSGVKLLHKFTDGMSDADTDWQGFG